jgi:uncharacterized damage-inducible protein DinB
VVETASIDRGGDEMKPDEVMTLYDYTWWARERLLAAADGLSEEDFARENGFTYKSIRGILVHTMEAEMFWCSRLLGETELPTLGPDELMTVEALRTRWFAEEVRLQGFLEGVTEASLAADFVIRRRNGQEIPTPLWQVMMHLVNHGTQHRSEAAEALTMVGRSPGSLDFLTFIWERENG